MAAPARSPGLVRRLWLPALAAFVAWHTIFDVTIQLGMGRYLFGHARHAAGQGPAVTIHGVMDEAVRQGALTGLAGAVFVFALVAAGRWLIARRRLRSG
jgi:hypothetical protein